MRRQRAERQADVVRPNQDRQYGLPEGQVQISDCEEPAERPHGPGPGMLLDSDPLHLFTLPHDASAQR